MHYAAVPHAAQQKIQSMNKSLPPLRALIVDDEAPARDHVARLLSNMHDIDVIGTASDGHEAVASILALRPDVVFLDIQMPGLNGFDVVEAVGAAQMPATIFVTAYDQHALKAFELAAIDYLLKPFDDDRFYQAVTRVKAIHELKQAGMFAARIRSVFESMESLPQALTTLAQTPLKIEGAATPDRLERIAVESRGQVRVVPVEQIDYITASGVYAELHVGDKTYVVRERMQVLDEQLDPQRFFRIHRSIIVQLNRIDVLLRHAGGDYILKLKTGAQVPVSRTRIEQLEKWMGVRSTES